MTDGLPLAVCDAGPLIHLDEVDCLDLIEGFSEVLVPSAVRKEVERHRPAALDLLHDRARFEGIYLPGTADFRSVVRTFALDRGEQEAIALALEYDDPILLTDDTAARLAAKALGLRVHGTLGLLLRGLRRGRRSREEILAVLEALPTRSTLHLRPSLLQEIVQEVRAWNA